MLEKFSTTLLFGDLVITEHPESNLILDVSIIVSLEQIGPVLKATTSSFLINSQKEAKVILYFTQRVVFTLGIGNQQVKFDKFHGPIELIDLPVNQEIILYPIKMNDNQSSDSRIQKFGRDVIICIHYRTESRNIIQIYQNDLYAKITRLLSEIAPGNEYEKINNDEILQTTVSNIKNKLNTFLKLRIEATKLGESLFNLSTLRQLDPIKRDIGSLLLSNLKGITKSEILKNLEGNYSDSDYLEALTELIEMGYIIEEPNSTATIYRLRD